MRFFYPFLFELNFTVRAVPALSLYGYFLSAFLAIIVHWTVLLFSLLCDSTVPSDKIRSLFSYLLKRLLLSSDLRRLSPVRRSIFLRSSTGHRPYLLLLFPVSNAPRQRFPSRFEVSSNFRNAFPRYTRLFDIDFFFSVFSYLRIFFRLPPRRGKESSLFVPSLNRFLSSRPRDPLPNPFRLCLYLCIGVSSFIFESSKLFLFLSFSFVLIL